MNEQELKEKIKRLQSELKNARNELCLKCGYYKERYLSPFNECKYRHGGEWSADINE